MREVVVYSATWCAGCKVVKKALAENNIRFEEVDITTVEGGAKAKELNVKSIPVTVVGDIFFVGSRPNTVKEILEAIID